MRSAAFIFADGQGGSGFELRERDADHPGTPEQRQVGTKNNDYRAQWFSLFYSVTVLYVVTMEVLDTVERADDF